MLKKTSASCTINFLMIPCLPHSRRGEAICIAGIFAKITIFNKTFHFFFIKTREKVNLLNFL